MYFVVKWCVSAFCFDIRQCNPFFFIIIINSVADYKSEELWKVSSRVQSIPSNSLTVSSIRCSKVELRAIG